MVIVDINKMNVKKTKKSITNFFASSNYIHWFILAGVTIIFTIFLYPNLVVTEHPYHLGDVAERDIKAPRDFFIEDKNATEGNRRQAVDEVLTVYDYNLVLLPELRKQTKESFAYLRKNYKLITENQNKTSSKQQSAYNQILQKKEDFEKILGISVSQGAYKILADEKFSDDISSLIIRILTDILQNGVVANKDAFLKESDKGIILRNVGTKTEKIVHNLKAYYSLDQAKTMVRIVGQPYLKNVDYTLLNLIVDFAQRLIQPNITLNIHETGERKKKASSEIKPVLYKIKAGEMLLREGERVTQVQLLKLQALHVQMAKEEISVSSIGAAMIIFCLLSMTYNLHIMHQNSITRDLNKNILFMASVLVTFFLVAEISAYLFKSLDQNTPFSIPAASMGFGIPLASSAMTICLFLGINLAVPFALIMAACTAIIFENRFEVFIYFLINSTMAAYWMQNCRERKVFIKAGMKLGLLNMILATSIDVYVVNFSGVKLLWDWSFAFLGGIVAGIVTSGIAPLVEIAFGYTTDIKLLELANLDQPILRRLMVEAPGTYNHSVIVGSMVEAAASEIGANPLLAKVCGYYHDIGKINKPLYFIENQSDGKNKHDKLAPSMSALILISHVKNGAEMARKNKLGQTITDAIMQHHGTSLIRFFYEKAKQLKGKDAVKIDDFRYPGPKPQTKEAGLVMLADSVEAASRTLDTPTPAKIQALVQNLINKIFSDGQLDDCELTLKDLHNIAKNFNKILNGIYHHRIEYSENPALVNGKGKNGSPDKQQAKPVQDIPGKDRKRGSNNFKRLGLS